MWVANDGSGTLARIDPGSNRVTRRIAVGRGACEVAAGFGALWVTNYTRGTVSRVDLRSYRVRIVRVGDTPFDVIAAAGRVWATVWRDGRLVEIDPATLRVVRRVAVGAYPTSLLFDGDSLWVGFGKTSTDVARVDPRTGSAKVLDVGATAPSHFVATVAGIW